MAKIPYRPDPPFDYSAARKAEQHVNTSLQQNKQAESALFKNAIRLADERNRGRASDAKVRGGEKAVNDRLLQLKKGGAQEAEQTTTKNMATVQAQVSKLTKEQADTQAALKSSNAQSPAESQRLFEQGLDGAKLKTKKRSNATEQDAHQGADAQSVQIANQFIATAPTPGVYMCEMPTRSPQDLGHFESVQSAAKFLEKMNADTSSKAWRFSLAGNDIVKGVHMQQSRDGGWSITLASDEEPADMLNEQLNTLVSALEEAGMQVNSVALS